jgi:hypothetical protein
LFDDVAHKEDAKGKSLKCARADLCFVSCSRCGSPCDFDYFYLKEALPSTTFHRRCTLSKAAKEVL